MRQRGQMFISRLIFSCFTPSQSAHPRCDDQLRLVHDYNIHSSRPPSAHRRCDKEAEFSSFTHCFLSFCYICLPFDDETMKGVSLVRQEGLFSMVSVSKFRVWPHRWDLVESVSPSRMCTHRWDMGLGWYVDLGWCRSVQPGCGHIGGI